MNLDRLKKYNKEVEVEAVNAFAHVQKRSRERDLVSWSDYKIKQITGELRGLLSEYYDFSEDDKVLLSINPEEPPVHVSDANIALSMFPLAQKLKGSPDRIAEEVVSILNKESRPIWLKSASSEGPYVNIQLSGEVYGVVLSEVQTLGDRYGEVDSHKKEIAYFDFSHPNIAKPIGVGNMRSTIIGEALVRIYEKVGYTVYRDNFLGDWGSQFGKLIYAYREWGDEDMVKKDPLKELKALYVRFHEEEEKDPTIKEKAAALSQQLENGDEELFVLWERFKEWSIQGFERLYGQLGVSFDSYLGESFFVDKAEEVIKECQKNLSDIIHVDPETGALVVEGLKEEVTEKSGQLSTEKELPSFILKKGDGSTIYISRDLAAMKFRRDVFNPQAMRFVVGNEQALNFRQLFSLARRAGYIPKETSAKHISFGLVMTDGKKMSTRKGTAVEFEEVLREAREKARQLMADRGESLEGTSLEEVAEIVGTGAVIYNDLRQSRYRDIDFNWDKMLSFEGGSAAYLQYTIVRIQSIIANAQGLSEGMKGGVFSEAKYEELSELNLAWKLAWFPLVLQRAAELDTPSIIATYLEELAQLFNSFYGKVSIIKGNQEFLESRIHLIQSVRQVLLNGLNLLNVRVPERM